MVTCDESSEMPKCPLINSGIGERDSFPFNDNSSQIFSTQDSSFLCLVFPSIFFLYIYFFLSVQLGGAGLSGLNSKLLSCREHFEFSLIDILQQKMAKADEKMAKD